jgi:hypothetical protein
VFDLDHFQRQAGVFEYCRHGEFNPTKPLKATQVTNEIFHKIDHSN